MSNSGKSLLFDRLRREHGPVETSTTKARGISSLRVCRVNIGGMLVRVQDLGGAEPRSSWQSYYQTSEKVIYVIRNDAQNFEESLISLGELIADLPGSANVILVLNIFLESGRGYLSKESVLKKTRAFCALNRVERVLCENLGKLASQSNNHHLIRALLHGSEISL